MRKGFSLVVLLAGLLLCGSAEAQPCNGCGIGYWYDGVPATGGNFTGSVSLATGASISLYNTADQTTNYEVGKLYWTSNVFVLQTTASGGGSFRGIQIAPGSGSFIVPTVLATLDDTYNIGVAGSNRYMGAYFTRWIQGSKSKALAGGSATTFLRVSVAQTAAANYGAGTIGYTVYASDGTDSQSLVGKLYFAMVNKAGTETCAIGEVGTPVLAQSSGSTLTCTFTCATASADTVDIAANCASGLVETTFTIEYRGDMHKTNTWTPQ